MNLINRHIHQIILGIVLGIGITAFASSEKEPEYVNPGQTQLPQEMLDTLAADEREAITWLYANMPYPDAYSHSPSFFLDNVRAALHAADGTRWQGKVPEREWRHFVLPVRINNEFSDSSRMAFHRELIGRIRDMSMQEAILEVNHWAHEKATYQPSDGRTSAPLSVVSQSTGRCGEESTLLVAALRSVGIPARQIYTPRWAHTDDNHAWVEAWADGKWHFLGACEPAPILDMAWFNAPASRGLLMHTDVTGRYDGREEQIASRPLTTTINVTPNYAPTGKITVEVVDKKENPVEGAHADFGIYNYAEFYPAVKRVTDKQGRAELLCGIGDMTVWATDGQHFGFGKFRPGNEGAVGRIILDKDKDSNLSFDLDITPPAQSGVLPSPSKELSEANDRRLILEDSIRNASAARRFVDSETAVKAAALLGVEPLRMTELAKKARSNGKTLIKYLGTIPAEKRDAVISMLETLPEKDLRDITTDVIDDCLPYLDNDHDEFRLKYIASPRLFWEHLAPYKALLRQAVSPKEAKSWAKNPQKAAEWVGKHISLDAKGNPASLMMIPSAVAKAGRADSRSRDIFCVALLRALSIPARIDPVTSRPQYGRKVNGSEQWIDLQIGGKDKKKGKSAEKALLTLVYSDSTSRVIPAYYTHFTLSRIVDGRLQLMEYDDATDMSGGELKLEVAPGQYLLLSGTRMADGQVLAHGEVFTVTDSDDPQVNVHRLVMRKDPARLSVIGNLNAENIYHDAGLDQDKSLLSTTGRGYYVMILAKPGDEPTAHILNDIRSLADEYRKIDNKIMVLFADADELARFDRGAFEGLPENVVFGVDNEGVSHAELVESLHLPDWSRPVVVIADTFNRVMYVSQGYTIGLPQRILHYLQGL